MALEPGVGLGLLYNMPPGLSIPCSVSPSVYTIFLRSMNTSSHHLIFGLTLRLVAYSFPYNIFFGGCGVGRRAWTKKKLGRATNRTKSIWTEI
jgi:hypothetical protein